MKVRSVVAVGLFAAVLTTTTVVLSMPATAGSATGRARPAPTDACGTQLEKADGSPWSCTFADDFSGNVLNRKKWVPQTAFSTGSESAFACYLDDPSTVSVSGGNLNLTVRRVAAPVACKTGDGMASTNYVAGMVSTYHLFSQEYGRFEARIRSTATSDPGLHEAFWLWPDDRVASAAVWPDAGEIDVSETYSKYPNLSVPFLHYSADSQGSIPGTNTAWDCTAYRGDWNTYTLEWSAVRLEIFVDGKSCLVNTSGDPAFQKPYIVAFTQALGLAGNEYDGRAPLPATMSIDYLRVWK
jgi:beta-glucanase (GH16 family)